MVLRPDRWGKSHYQVMSVGQVVGRGAPLPSVTATRAHPPPDPGDPKEEPGQSRVLGDLCTEPCGGGGGCFMITSGRSWKKEAIELGRTKGSSI